MISLVNTTQLLMEHQLLKEIIYQNSWHFELPKELLNEEITQITYDSRQIESQALFFCKGLTFKAAYLEQALAQGARFYVTETVYELPDNQAVGIIVTDVKKAMAVISMAFYGYPQEQLKIIAYTGTKGKTTASYFCKYILDEATDYKTAMFSTMETVLDGKTPIKSLLTTPESVDLYRMMAEAVKNGMTHLVMEVSSQAYKTERVYNLTFDVGIFLNISPDHIGSIEHPDFDDYFYCKRQLLKNSKQLILNCNSDYYALVNETSRLFTPDVWTYGDETTEASYQFNSKVNNHFDVQADVDLLTVAGEYQINLPGDFNQGNALSAILATRLVGASQEAIQTGLAVAKVPGRMEKMITNKGVPIYIDYAHNFLSLKTLLTFVKNEHQDKKIHVVIGSTGGKGVSRRQDFSQVLSEFADVTILTTDDPGNEEPLAIIADIQEHLADRVTDIVVLDRKEAITKAIAEASVDDVIVIAGKGPDLYQLIDGQRIPYEGDLKITEMLIGSGY